VAILGWRGGLLLGALLGGGCGDPLVDEQYQGQVLFTLRGNVMGASDEVGPAGTVRIAVFWSPQGSRTLGTAGLVEQPSASDQATLPFSFTLNLFDPPPAAQIYTPPDGDPYAIAQLLGYPDRNGNRLRDPDEPIVAASESRALLYAPTELPANRSPTGLLIPAGYHLIFSSIPCGPRPLPMPAPPPGPACPVMLGQPCMSDIQCAPGICLHDFLLPWPQGGCALNDPPPTGCGPPSAVRVSQPGPMTMPSPTYWLKACTTDADCGRDFPYQCDLALGACAPTRIFLMQLGDPPMVAPWCR